MVQHEMVAIHVFLRDHTKKRQDNGSAYGGQLTTQSPVTSACLQRDKRAMKNQTASNQVKHNYLYSFQMIYMW